MGAWTCFEGEVFVIAHQRGRFGVVAGYYVADVEVVVVAVVVALGVVVALAASVAVVAGGGVHWGQNVARYWEVASRNTSGR